MKNTFIEISILSFCITQILMLFFNKAKSRCGELKWPATSSKYDDVAEKDQLHVDLY